MAYEAQSHFEALLQEHVENEESVSSADDIAELAESGWDAATGIDPRRCRVQVAFNHQAREIGQGVDHEDGELGAGDRA